MIFKTFKERKRLAARDGEPEIYAYDQAPDHMRHQICLALGEGIGHCYLASHPFSPQPNANDIWEEIDRICRKELFSYLHQTQERNLARKFLSYIMTTKDIEDFLSAVEIGCIGLQIVKDEYGGTEEGGAKLKGIEAIQEINGRFEQHSIGYQFENGSIIRVDSKLVHAEVIKPALMLLTNSIFTQANEDFMTAHRHYRYGEFKDLVTSANRAFESMLKAMCDAEKWQYAKGDRAAELVTKVRNGGLFTHDFDKSFDAYIAMLKTGLPAVRNDAGGHGAGLAAEAVTAEIARFAINLTATNVLFLGETYQAMKGRWRRG